MPATDISATTTKLCTACGLCCNGVLFADVRLRPGDDPARLVELGIPIQAGRRTNRFRQPCSCLRDGVCRIYAERPERCRTFECRLLQRAMRGEVTEHSALRTIAATRRRAETVQRILRELGDHDESQPLSRRYQRVMRQPIDLAESETSAELRGKLMLAVAELIQSLERDFLS